MNAACLILIARLCLPASVQSVEFHNSPVGSEAVVKFAHASLKFDLWSDSINSTGRGLKEYCERGACIHFSAKPGPGPGISREYRVRLDGEGSERVLFFRADDQKSFEKGVENVGILASKADRTIIPLSALTGVAPRQSP